MTIPIHFDGFDWDAHNEQKIAAKHGISRAVIEAAMRARFKVLEDKGHSMHEARLIALAHDAAMRPMYIAFTLRVIAGRTLARVVSARYMHQKELKSHGD